MTILWCLARLSILMSMHIAFWWCLFYTKRLIYCPFYLQVPVDYTWANEILDHELPGLFKRRKSQSGSETVSSAIFKLCFQLCITFVSLFRCSMPLMSCFWILGQGISKALAKAAPVPLNGGVQSSKWGQHVLRVFEHLMEFDSQQDRLDEMVHIVQCRSHYEYLSFCEVYESFS